MELSPPLVNDGVPDSVKVLRQFRILFNAVRSQFHQVQAQVGLGGAQLWALGLIEQNPDIQVGEIARQMDIHQSTASNLIKTLMRKGLVSRAQSSVDRRNACLRATFEGVGVMRRVNGPFAGVLPAALGQLPSETLRRMSQDLFELTQLIGSDMAAAQVPLSEIA